jgi:hypothetical protein
MRAVTPAPPDPAAIRMEVLDRMLADRDGWARTDLAWTIGAYELIPRTSPGLSYELWRGPRCVAAVMVPRDAIAVAECLAGTDSLRPSSPQRLYEGLSIPFSVDG